MAKPRDVKRVLRLAKWTYKDYVWQANSSGRVFRLEPTATDYKEVFFDLSDPVVDNAWRMKLYQETGYRIEKKKDEYVATRKDGGIRKSPDLLTLIEICMPEDV